jgi:hypothetical protein
MNRSTNIECLQSIYQKLNSTSDPLALRALAEAGYIHQIIEAVLSENIDSLPEATHHG